MAFTPALLATLLAVSEPTPVLGLSIRGCHVINLASGAIAATAATPALAEAVRAKHLHESHTWRNLAARS